MKSADSFDIKGATVPVSNNPGSAGIIASLMYSGISRLLWIITSQTWNQGFGNMASLTMGTGLTTYYTYLKVTKLFGPRPSLFNKILTKDQGIQQDQLLST